MLDRLVAGFIAAHPNAVVVELGCGLETRMHRIAPPATVDYDIDHHTCWMRSPQPICSAFPRPRSTGGLHSETRAPMSALPAMRCLSACADGTPTSCANGSAG